MSVFLAVFTEYVDDYKLRGRDPSTSTRRAFKTKTGANKFVAAKLFEQLRDHTDMNDIEELMRDNDFAEVIAYDKEKNSMSLRAGMEDAVAELDNLTEDYRRGEFVPEQWEWEIEEIVLGDLPE